ncbi:MAG: radical SAM protein [Thermoprotei archaeon]|nr:MAG: radical SAM protein [Thermoprotei archaeon]RLF00947.1 MAG: radical SAM protein [Thermoprotei archaeon]HDI74865.1 radical SAM protein [Thermoprotei archaeon]
MIFRISWYLLKKEKECAICGKKSALISRIIGVCVDCLRDSPKEALEVAMKAHEISRGKYGLPSEPPRDPKGIKCTFCANECKIPEEGYGFCGLVRNQGNKLIRLAGTPDKAIVDCYYDPLPTNCVAEWTCPGCTGRGYPKYAYEPSAERGYYNLAVFYGACNLDCLFCQNWHYRENTFRLSPTMSSEELASKITRRVSCICFFGGDPSPQMPHALKASTIALEQAVREGRILRICWETNGLMNPVFLERAVELSLESGGCIKFDVKAWTPPVYKALTGCDNSSLFENFRKAAKRINERKEPPLVVASILLVPGYVDYYEVEKIVNFIADIDTSIPLSLLAFHPDYLIDDLPPTSRKHAMEAYALAKRAGLENVNIGNIWLLGDYY